MMKAAQLLQKALQTTIGDNREDLINSIQKLLRQDPEKVIWLLYRFDVDEQKLKRKLGEKDIISEAELITDALLSRCAQIIETRKKFSSENSSDWSFDLD